MLVLSRGVEEKFFIEVAGVTITVQILRVKGQSVRVGIDAPREISIYRDDANVKHRGKLVPNQEAGRAS